MRQAAFFARALRAARPGQAQPARTGSDRVLVRCLGSTPLAQQQADADPFAALDAQTPPPPSSLVRSQAESSDKGLAEATLAEEDSAGAADLTEGSTDWSRSFSGLSRAAFPKEAADILLAPLDPLDVEIKPDGIIYLPEIKYRRILNRAFGPGGWGLAPRSASTVTSRSVSREYALVCLGRLVSVARGEQDYFTGPEGVSTATEGCRSNALMRCCKDLGVASELWDPNYINWWKKTYATTEWIVGPTGKKCGPFIARPGPELIFDGRRPNWAKKRSAEWRPAFLRE